MSYTFKISKEEIPYFKGFLSSIKNSKEIDIKSAYEAFRFEINGGIIIGYNTGNIVYGDEELKLILYNILYDVRKHKLDFDYVIGSDETGKGEWLGPLTVAAVALTPIQVLILQVEGIKDSKVISHKQIPLLSNYIEKYSTKIAIESLEPSEFNKIMEDMTSDKNLNDILAILHTNAIHNVFSKIYNDSIKIKIIIDEFDKIKTNKYLRGLYWYKNVIIIQKPKAEEEVAVAAASIVAKNKREKIINGYVEKYDKKLLSYTSDELKNKPYAKDIIKMNYLKK